MVQHAVSAEAPNRGSAAGSGSSVEAGRIVEGRVGGGRGARVVCEDRGPASAADSVVAGFFELVASVFQRRVSDRCGGESEILERREGSGAAGEAGGCAGGVAGVESRCVR